MTAFDLPKPDHAKNMRIIGHTNQGGLADGIQVMVSDGYAYVGHVYSGGFTVLDVRDPRNPKFVRHIKQPAGTWAQHLQTHGDILIVNNMKDMLRDTNMKKADDYYTGAIGEKVDLSGQGTEWSSGIRVYDISDRSNPREIGFMELPGLGVHRVWWDGGDYAYMSSLPPGFSDDIFTIADFKNPEKPHPVGELWLPGMNTAKGETRNWDPKYRYALHHVIVKGDLGCGAWRDGGMTTIDVSNRHDPKLLAHVNTAPPFAGGTHNTLPLPGRGLCVAVEEAVFDHQADGQKHTWIYDIRVPTKPISISTMPIPAEEDYVKKAGQFGPHNIHENRVESFQSENIVFVTYQNAGVRVYDISNPFRPEEIASLVPPKPPQLMAWPPNRPQVLDTTDIFPAKKGLVYITDMNAGLYILETDKI